MRSIAFVFTVLLSALPVQLGLAQQTRPAREGVISGRVITDDGQPAAGAQVAAHSAGKLLEMSGMYQTAVCDDEGNFRIGGLANNVFSLSATWPGYVATGDRSARHRIGESVTISLVKGGVITGRVTDEFGEPMVGVSVAADRLRDLDGNRVSSDKLSRSAITSRMTDDRGVYRLYGLESGVFIVYVSGSAPFNLSQAQIDRDPATYHPSSSRGAAAEITVRSGEEVSGIDIRRRNVRGYSISGTIAGEVRGEGIINPISVILTASAGKHITGMTAFIGARNFSIHGIEDGQYEIAAIRMNESVDISVSSSRRVMVRGADVSGIELNLVKLGSISGRVVIDPSKPPNACKSETQFTIEELLVSPKRGDKTAASQLQILHLIESQLGSGAAPDKQGSFTLKNLEAGRYRLEAELPDENWYVSSISQSAADISRTGVTLKQGEKLSGIELKIAVGAAGLSGKVVQAGGQSPGRLRVHLVPAEASAEDDLLRYAETEVRGGGAFELKHITPGKYLLVARQMVEKEAGDDQPLPVAWETIERAKLRREAEAAKNEIELEPCGRVKDYALRVK